MQDPNLKHLEKLIDDKMRELAYQVNQSTKKENSGLIIHLQNDLKHLTDTMEKGFKDVRMHIEKTDVAMNEKASKEQVYLMKEEVGKNTEFRIQTEARTGVWKWIIGTFGIGNVAMFVSYIITKYGS